MSNLVEHAKRELSLLGEDSELIENLVETVAKFAEFGHSGGSAPFAIAYLEKLLRFEPLTPLTSDPAEWIDRSEQTGHPLWQNARDGRAFSEDGGKTWRLVDEKPKLFGLWRVSDNRAETGWVTSGGGRVIVHTDPQELANRALANTEVREFPKVVPYEVWADPDQTLAGPGLGMHVRRTGPEQYREGIRLLAEAAELDEEGRTFYGEVRRTDPAVALLTSRGRAHLTAAGVALLASVEQADSISWREVLGL